MPMGFATLPCPPKGFPCRQWRFNLVHCSFAIQGVTAGKRTGRSLTQGLHPLAQELNLSSGLCLGCTAGTPGPGHEFCWSCSQPWSTDLFFCLDLRPASLLWTSLVITRFLPVSGPNLLQKKLNLVYSVLSNRENRSSSLHQDSGIWRLK